MAGPLGQQETAVDASAAVDLKETSNPAPTSPAQSDKSSDSEGKPVRDKLKETRIDAKSASDPAPSSDQPMNNVPNGSAKVGDSASGSDSERGRLRRKRSREDFEKDHEVDNKHPEKKQDKEERHHTRKRSRDVKDIESGVPLKPAATSVTTIEEKDADEQMPSPSRDNLKAPTANASPGTESSPKNKRTRDQVEESTVVDDEAAKDAVANGKPTAKAEDERESKRLRDKDEAQPATNAVEGMTKIPPGSGFANTSAISPFAAISPKPQASKPSDRPKVLPQTSEDKFKASGFGSFSSSAASPFGGLASPPASGSPFTAASDNKRSSFTSSAASSTATGSGFGTLGSLSKSAFGGSSFGASLGGGFGSLGTAKPGLPTFATPDDLTIKGLKSKQTAFGTPGDKLADADGSDEEDGDDNDTEKETTEEERKSSQPLLSQQPHETGEEGELTTWAGRAKLYTMAGEGATRGWKERGVGTFKFNVTVEEPKKARFVLRADGTHRLLLNVAVTKQLVFGSDSNGGKPKDGRLLFNTPNTNGQIDMHLLKLKAERAVELWEEVSKVQETEL